MKKTNKQYNKHNSAFTIVELLIVIVVIAILAAITVVAYNGIQERARATVIISDLQKIEKGLKLLAIEDGRDTWWIDTSFTGSNNPNVNTIISSTNLSSYLGTLSPVPGFSSSSYSYDNDGETVSISGCTGIWEGPNIILYGISSVNVRQKVDDMIDDGNLSCGKVRSDSNNLSYKLSSSQVIE